MIEYPAPGVKRTAIAAVGQMCICVHKANQEMHSSETQSALSNMLSVVILKLLAVTGEDIDSMVVMTAIDTMYEMLDKIGQPVIQVQGISDAILTRMKEVFTHKVIQK